MKYILLINVYPEPFKIIYIPTMLGVFARNGQNLKWEESNDVKTV